MYIKNRQIVHEIGDSWCMQSTFKKVLKTHIADDVAHSEKEDSTEHTESTWYKHSRESSQSFPAVSCCSRSWNCDV